MYAQLVIFFAEDSRKIPPSLKPYMTGRGRRCDVRLLGERVIAAETETIAELIRCGQVTCLYASPFQTDPAGAEPSFRALYERFPAGWDHEGCGAAVLDTYHQALLYHSLRREAGGTARRAQSMEEAGWRSFCTREDAAAQIADFLRNGLRTKICQEALPVDPGLFQWLCTALGRDVAVPEDLEEITELRAETFSQGTPALPGWLRPAPGDWRILGRLPRLERLEFPHVCIENFSFLLRCRRLKALDLRETSFYEGAYLERLEELETLALPQAELPGFSFLKACRRLKSIDVSGTNFSDCSLLLELPALESACLPPRGRLLHTEALEQLAAAVRTCEPKETEKSPPACYLFRGKLPLGENGLYAQAVAMDGRVYRGTMISKELVQRLLRVIRAGKTGALAVSADADMERIILTVDIRDGWAVVALQDFEQDAYYLPRNERYADTEETAPPRLGGQSPVPKSQALDDLKLAADCVGHYLRTGKLSPKLRWIQAG